MNIYRSASRTLPSRIAPNFRLTPLLQPFYQYSTGPATPSPQQPLTTDEQHEHTPPPKAPIQSKLWAFAVGGGLALSYAYYRRSKTPQQATSGSIDGFTKYTLLDKDAISSTCSIFTIAPLTGKKSVIDQEGHPRSVLSILLKQPDLQIARSYTILPPLADQPKDAIRLLIRRETNGEVSGYLHDMPIGSDIEIRGPYVDMTVPNNTANVVFLAGGTGVAPALKVAEMLKGTANVHVLWASRRAEDCSGGTSDHRPSDLMSNAKALFGLGLSQADAASQQKNTLVMLLDMLKLQAQGKAFSCDYYVDEHGKYIRPHDVAKLIRTVEQPQSTNLIIVSGPDGFIYHWAGAKEYINGRQEQGRLGGVLSKLDLKGWQVIKL